MFRKLIALATVALTPIAMTLSPGIASAYDGGAAPAEPAPSGYKVEYTIETGSDGVQYKVITKINHKPLIDGQGNPKPLRVPVVEQPMINTTACATHGGGWRPSPVRVTYGTWVSPDYKCYENVGTAPVGISGVDEIYGGYWYGTIYYEAPYACVADSVNPGKITHMNNETLCVLSISHHK